MLNEYLTISNKTVFAPLGNGFIRKFEKRRHPTRLEDDYPKSTVSIYVLWSIKDIEYIRFLSPPEKRFLRKLEKRKSH